MRRRLFIVAALLFCIAGYTGAWFYLGSQLQQRVEVLLEQWRQKGWTIDYQASHIAGFPFRLAMEIDRPEISYNDIVYSRVEGKMVFGAVLWRPTEITSWAAGRHHVQLTLRENQTITAQGDGFSMGLLAFEKGTFKFSYDNLEIRYQDQTIAETGAVNFQVSLLQDSKLEENLMNATALLQDLSIPALSGFPFGDVMQKLELTTSLTGDLMGSSLSQRIRNWYESDGTLEVNQLSLHWGPLQLEAEGTTTVDEDLQPMAAFSAYIGGMDQTLNAFVDAGWMEKRVASLVRLGLGFLSDVPTSESESDRHRLPLTVQGGRFFIGPIAVGKTPKVEWE